MIYADVLLKINTPEGNEILLLDKKPDEYEKTILVIGVFHGDEPDGEYLINEYLSKRTETKNRMLFIPCLNPDGLAKKQRVNSNGVDLNRNFPTQNWTISEKDSYYGGEHAASEVETRFILYVIERYKPDAILSLHEPYKIINYDGPAKELALKLSEINGYNVEENIGYPTPGSFGTYCGTENNIPTITLELPENSDKAELLKDNMSIFDYLSLQY